MKFWLSLSLGILLFPPLLLSAPDPSWGKIELLRDEWGIPHIFADSDAGAFYGLGYAHAQDRAFQMVFSLRIIQGRTAEVLGNRPKQKQGETTLTHDRKFRILGFYCSAQRLIPHLDPESVLFLQAYSQGVNDVLQNQPSQRLPLFQTYDLALEPWTPADCIATWWHMGYFFSGEGLHDTLRFHQLKDETTPAGRGQTRPLPQDFTPPVDDAAAVIQEQDVSPAWLEEVRAFMHEKSVAVLSPASGEEGPKFSHAWVVGGKKTTTGSAVLVSDPQTPVRNPSMFYEAHISGKTFNARGIGVPGSPLFLIGWTAHVAWGLTALGADQADQFFLHTDQVHPGQYRYDGEWRPITSVTETIQVKGESPQTLVVQESHFGPIVNAIAHDVRPGETVALQRVPLCDTDRETIQGAVAMLRAQNAEAFFDALAGWRFPSANIVFGDTQGRIGYSVLGAIPLRSPLALDGAQATHIGSESRYDWLGFMPPHLLPHAFDPANGYFLSANHRPIGSFYPNTLGNSTGSNGDTLRSWRLRQRLQEQESFTPEAVLVIHEDQVNAAKQGILQLAYHARDVQQAYLSPDTLDLLAYLEPWYAHGAQSDWAIPGTELADRIPTMFRMMGTELAILYGGGESGLAKFLKSVRQRLEADPHAALTEAELDWIDTTLETAWVQTANQFGPLPEAWHTLALEANAQQKLPYMDSLDGFGGLDPRHDLALPSLSCLDGGTIHSQRAQSYTQWVPLHDVDQALSILPIGQSEHPDSPYRLSTYTLWSQGKLHPAPLSRAAVEKWVKEKQTLAP